MISRKDLEALADQIRDQGGTVDFVLDAEGYIYGIEVNDCVKRGDFPLTLGTVAGAELMRDWLANRGRFA